MAHTSPLCDNLHSQDKNFNPLPPGDQMTSYTPGSPMTASHTAWYSSRASSPWGNATNVRACPWCSFVNTEKHFTESNLPALIQGLYALEWCMNQMTFWSLGEMKLFSLVIRRRPGSEKFFRVKPRTATGLLWRLSVISTASAKAISLFRIYHSSFGHGQYFIFLTIHLLQWTPVFSQKLNPVPEIQTRKPEVQGKHGRMMRAASSHSRCPGHISDALPRLHQSCWFWPKGEKEHQLKTRTWKHVLSMSHAVL